MTEFWLLKIKRPDLVDSSTYTIARFDPAATPQYAWEIIASDEIFSREDLEGDGSELVRKLDIPEVTNMSDGISEGHRQQDVQEEAARRRRKVNDAIERACAISEVRRHIEGIDDKIRSLQIERDQKLAHLAEIELEFEDSLT